MTTLNHGGSAALRAHRRFVASVKSAVQQVHGTVPNPSTILPTAIGARPLDFTMPPMMEQAFGYHGDLRFLEFSYWPRSQRFGYSDGGDHIPSDEGLWMAFLGHPLISRELDASRYPTLYGRFGGEAGPTDLQESGDVTLVKLLKSSQRCHSLLFDRRDRRPYLCTRDELIFFFPLTEPEAGDDHTVFVDGLLMSPGTEDYKSAGHVEHVDQLRAWLDEVFSKPNGRASSI
jgi:hypothetical protein